MLNKTIAAFLGVLLFVAGAYGQILVEDADSIWDNSLSSPSIIADISDRLVVEYASNIWDDYLVFPEKIGNLASLASERILIEYASTIWDEVLVTPQSVVSVANTASPRIVVEYASTIWDQSLSFPQSVVTAANSAHPRVVVEYALTISTFDLVPYHGDVEDSDNDGVPDSRDNCPGAANPDQADLDGDDIGNVCDDDVDGDGISNDQDSDNDNDGMPNLWEVENDFNPIDPNDALGDADSDGLTNLDEYLNNTNPRNFDSDHDGISDSDEVNYGNNPIGIDAVDLHITSGDVVLSLTGDNRIFVKLINGFCIPKAIYVSLTGIDPAWYTIAPEDQNFVMLPFARKVVTIQLHLPEDCNIPTQEYPFHLEAAWQHNGQAYVSGDDANLIVTPNPNIYPLSLPSDNRMGGNTIFVAWKTDIPASSTLFYRKLGDEAFIEMPVAVDATEHVIMLTDLQYFTYYEMYTESRSLCGGVATTDLSLVKTGKAVKFVQNINEFWVDRDYNQQVTVTVTNTDMIPHTFLLSMINDNKDIVAGFVGAGTPGREASLDPGESTDVELMIHAPDALKTRYDIYLKMVSDPQEDDTFEDYSHAIVHVRPFVANLDIQPVESTPGLMTNKYRLMNYGDTLTDIGVYVDEANKTKTWMNPFYNHARLENGEYIEFDLQSQEYTTGTLYARSGDYVVSMPFEIGCPPETDLKTYTLNDFSITAEIKDWYCTNKMQLDLPFALPRGFGYDDIDSAAIEINFSLPMAHEKYDPHTVDIAINGNRIALLENIIPEGKYLYRIPVSSLHLGPESSAENVLSMNIEGITEGQYIVVSNFKVILNINEMQIDLCVPPIPPGKIIIPDPETKITQLEPTVKYRPGDVVDDLKVTLTNNGNNPHRGILTLTLENNSFNGEVQPKVYVETIDVPPGKHTFPDEFEIDQEKYNYQIPADADDIEYTLSATFENITMGSSYSFNNRPGFYVRTPLIIVHGIMGSELRDAAGDPLWSIPTLALPCDNELNSLLFNSSGNPVQQGIGATRVISEFAKVQLFGHNLLIMGDILNGLEKHLMNNRYKIYPAGRGTRTAPYFDISNIALNPAEKEDVFYFVYDWRFDNSITANNLNTFIAKIIEVEDYPKVNIIAHSMGGLVCKSLFLQDTSILEKIDKTVFIGTPNLGAVEAFTLMKHGLRHLIFGEMISVDKVEQRAKAVAAVSIIKDAVTNLVKPDLVSKLSLLISMVERGDELVDPEFCSDGVEIAGYIVSIAGLYQGDIAGALFTIYDYYNLDKDLNFIRDSQAKKLSETLPSLYQLLPSERYFSQVPGGYYEVNGNQIGSYNLMDDQLSILFNDLLLNEAQSLHTSIDTLPLNHMPENSYAIVGCKQCTTNFLEESDDPSLQLRFIAGDGDGTVPIESALDINVKKKYAALYAKHLNLPSNRGVRLLTRSLLKGYESDYAYDLFHPVEEYVEGVCGVPICQAGGKISIKIPHIGIYFPLLINLETKEIVTYTGNGIYLGILGSDYRITNDGVEIFVPQGSVYTLEFHGIDQEYLDIKFRLMTEGGVIKTYIYSNLTLNMGGCGEVTFDLTSAMTDPVLRLDHECDGVFEEVDIKPSDVLNEAESDDFTAPTTTAAIDGIPSENNWYTSDVSITLNATDNVDGSGVLTTRYRFQNETTFTNYAEPICITEPGEYTLTYFSIDRNLNKEIEKTLQVKVDNKSPQVLNVTDAGYYNIGTAGFSASWQIQTGISGLQDVQYSLGTTPGLNDVINWTSAGSANEINLSGLSLTESCTDTIYINVKAINGAGMESEVVSSDGVIVLKAGGDPDGDGFINEDEIVAGSNPCNELSIPKDTTITLKPGFNLICIPAEILCRPDLRDWIPLLGTIDDIEKVMIYDHSSREFISFYPQSSGNPSYILRGGEALIVYAKQEFHLPFTSALCNRLNLNQGLNFIGFACPPEGYSAFDLLNALGSDNVVSIQRYSYESGSFETASFDNGDLMLGVNFAIIPGEGYLIYMKKDVEGFMF